jgi:hypothetical protein
LLYENFNNFGRKIEEKGGVLHISIISSFNTIMIKKTLLVYPVAKLGGILL